MLEFVLPSVRGGSDQSESYEEYVVKGLGVRIAMKCDEVLREWNATCLKLRSCYD